MDLKRIRDRVEGNVRPFVMECEKGSLDRRVHMYQQAYIMCYSIILPPSLSPVIVGPLFTSEN